ncbi:polysaccharide pyruvyl transferase family protein [Salinicola aestuarinus]|uniref:polysaccharide pyruvyl transferase family protein n=1 Tax=Salinicola aestuarinus TaxID=1949082 RepID=UPI000DA15655|nr:polysaccharide pyruvyl transferase family protein [Salinicola aestuarinus]
MRGKIVLYGVGAKGSSQTLERRQKKRWQRLLNPNYKHSVRDNLAASLVRACGHEAINTSCHTLWDLPDEIKSQPAQRQWATFSLTHYRKNPEKDREIIAFLKSEYDNLAFWIQQSNDLSYLQSLINTDSIKLIAPNIEAYDNHLACGGMDVIGTRLHGGIHALHYGNRSIILSVDHRARLIGQETGLPIIPRDTAVEDLPGTLDSNRTIDIAGVKKSGMAFLMQFHNVN